MKPIQRISATRDVNPLIDRAVAAEIRGLTSPGCQSLPHFFPCEAYFTTEVTEDHRGIAVE